MNYPENFTPSHFPPVYLLAGGASRRMGRDKAMLEIKGEKLLVLLAAAATRLCGRATVVAPAGRYESLGLRVIEDKREGAGPLAGIEAALLDSSAEWTIVWACDMPGVTESWLRRLAAKAEVVPPEVLCVASGESLAEANPLCAAWRRGSLRRVQAALEAGEFRVRSLLERIETRVLVPDEPEILANWNRPEDVRFCMPGRDKEA
jgi:molybdenum cofactor guanylyltransferase